MAIRGLSYSPSCGSSLLSCQWRLQAETAGRVCHKAEPAKLQNKVDDLFKRADPEENAPASRFSSTFKHGLICRATVRESGRLLGRGNA